MNDRGDIDWAVLARDVGVTDICGRAFARAALARLGGTLDASAAESAVEHYVAGGSGAELARSVLWLLRPPAAMERCLSIFRADSDLERRRAAIELLRVVADACALAWLDELLADPDEQVARFTVGLIDQLLLERLVSLADVRPALRRAARRSDALRRHARRVAHFAPRE